MKHITINREKHITLKREKDVFNPENMLLGVGVFPAHATRDNESMFYQKDMTLSIKNINRKNMKIWSAVYVVVKILIYI